MTQRRMSPPQVGETIRVEYNPKNHDVRVLLDEAHDRKALERHKADDFQAALDAPVCTPPPLQDDVARALRGAGLGDLVDGGQPQIMVQSEGEQPVAVPLHAMDPSVGGAAGILATVLTPGIELDGKAIFGNNDAVAIDWNAFINRRA